MSETLEQLNQPDVISFDVWMTLIRSHPEYKQVQANMIAERFGITDPDFVHVMKESDRGTDRLSDITGEQYGPVERLNRLFGSLGIDAPQEEIVGISGEIQKKFVEYPIRLMEPGLNGSLRDIHEAGFTTSLLSNTGFIDGEYMRQALTNAGIAQHMDHLIFSNEVGVAKPDPAIYRHLADTSGSDFDSMLHIGDNYKTDYLGPRRLGINAVHLAAESEAALRVSSIAEFAQAVLKLRERVA